MHIAEIIPLLLDAASLAVLILVAWILLTRLPVPARRSEDGCRWPSPNTPIDAGVCEVVTYPGLFHVSWVRSGSRDHVAAINTPGYAVRTAPDTKPEPGVQ